MRFPYSVSQVLIMSDQQYRVQLLLPKSWKNSVRSAVVRVISLAQVTIASARAQAIDNQDANPFEVEIERPQHEIALLRDEIRIKDQRMRRIAAERRPHYQPIERLEILELRAVCGWSLRQAADAFLLSPATVWSWTKRAVLLVDGCRDGSLLPARDEIHGF